MCGIAGLWEHGTDAPEALARMLAAMRHRGPDGQGTLEYPGGAAGMVRLALVDLSERGQQPMWSATRDVALLMNGELYEFRAERARLAAAGYMFSSTTDTEVALALYLEQGESFVDKLRGMFAIAVLDFRARGTGVAPTLLLARDPFGMKPLYLTKRGRGVAFASELRALVAGGVAERRIDPAGLADYLRHGFVLQPSTMLAGVSMLAPGTIVSFVPGEAPRERRFWTLPPAEPHTQTLTAAAADLRGVLEESVRLHALADAPVGAFLSGGVDSTGIVGLMRRHIPDLRTYTLRFPDVPGADEAAEATESARWLGVQNEIIDVDAGEVARLLPRFAGELDQPSIDGLNTWLVARGAARHVKGVLSGLGGDELFAGYPTVRRMRELHTPRGRAIRRAAGLLAHAPLGHVPGRFRDRVSGLTARRSPLALWAHGHTVFWPHDVARLTGTSSDLDRLEQATPGWANETDVGAALHLDTVVYMGHQLLRDSDATSMAHSLELRTPLVDVRVAEWSRRCPDSLKISPAAQKLVLREALADLLPPGHAARPKKGFSLPFHHWLRGPLAPLLADATAPETIARRGLLDPEPVRAAFGYSDARDPRLLYPRLWSLLVLELWCRQVLDGAPAQAGAKVMAA